MRLVIVYQMGDGYTYSCRNTVPVEYESAEAFAVEFEKAAKDSYKTGANYGNFMFAGHKWSSQNHAYYDNGKDVYDEPTVLTVDEWFDRNSV